MKKILLRLLLLASLSLSAWFTLWIFYDMVTWGKSLFEALVSSWWNVVGAGGFLGLSAWLSLVEDNPNMLSWFHRKHRGRVELTQEQREAADKIMKE
jgi:hypothetical protein